MITKESAIRAASSELLISRSNAKNLIYNIWPDTDLLSSLGESIRNRSVYKAEWIKNPELQAVRRQKHNQEFNKRSK